MHAARQTVRLVCLLILASSDCEIKQARCLHSLESPECTPTTIRVLPQRIAIGTKPQITITVEQEDIVSTLDDGYAAEVYLYDANNRVLEAHIDKLEGQKITATFPTDRLSVASGGLGVVELRVGSRTAKAEVRLYTPTQFDALVAFPPPEQRFVQMAAVLAHHAATLAVESCSQAMGIDKCEIKMSQVLGGMLSPASDDYFPAEFSGTSRECWMGASAERLLFACPVFDNQYMEKGKILRSYNRKESSFPDIGTAKLSSSLFFSDPDSAQVAFLSPVWHASNCMQEVELMAIGESMPARTLLLETHSTIRLLAFGRPAAAELKQPIPDIVTIDDDWSTNVLRYEEPGGWRSRYDLAVAINQALKTKQPMNQIPNGMVLADFDHDGLLDLLVASVAAPARVPTEVECTAKPTNNTTKGVRLTVLYGLNLSGQQHVVAPLTALVDISLPENSSMQTNDYVVNSLEAGDLDGDGDMDLIFTDLDHGVLFASNKAK